MKKRVLLSVIFLCIGVFIYFIFYIGFFRKNTLFFSFVRNYIPDTCWTLSFFFLSINFTKSLTKNSIIVNSIYVFIISILYESLQLFSIIKGTFDLIDILIYALSIILSCFIELILRRKENEKN